VDCATALPGSASLGAIIERAAACWTWALVLAIPLALVLAGLDRLARLPVAVEPAPGGGSAFERVRLAVLERGLDGTAFLLALCADGLLIAALAHLAATEVSSRMQQLRFIALAIALLVTASVALVALFHLPLQALIARALSGVARLGKLGAWLRRPGLVSMALGGLAAAACASIVALRWDVAQYLPWPVLGRMALALALGAAVVAGRRWVPMRARRFAPRALVVLSLGCVALTLALDSQRTDSGEVVRFETLSGRAGGAALVALFDTDGDGYLPWRGGDCAPSDPRIHPAANEIPGNGRDENCDGDDRRDGIAIARGRFDYEVPKSFHKPRQIFLITIDALQYHRLFAKGTTKPVTPILDALARRSVYFRAAFSQGPSTRNAFPSMFTSRWDCQIAYVPGIKRPHAIKGTEQMLAETLRDAGYHTLAVLPNIYFFPKVWKGLTDGFRSIVELPSTSRKKGGIRNADAVTGAAVKALSSFDPKAELFAWVHYFDAHSPYHKVEKPDIGPWGDDLQSVYNSEVEFIDQQLGKLLSMIEARGFTDPMIIITADHGTSIDDEDGRKPKDLSTEMLRVPLIVHAPWLKARTVDTLVSTMDIAPTLANLLQLGKGQRYEGMSLVPELATGKGAVPRHLLHFNLWPERQARGEASLVEASFRSEEYHLVDDVRDGRRSLFSWREDAREVRDLAHTPAHGAQRKVLQATLTSLIEELCGKPEPR
jgi:arylsulfatase A-like enzyme